MYRRRGAYRPGARGEAGMCMSMARGKANTYLERRGGRTSTRAHKSLFSHQGLVCNTCGKKNGEEGREVRGISRNDKWSRPKNLQATSIRRGVATQKAERLPRKGQAGCTEVCAAKGKKRTFEGRKVVRTIQQRRRTRSWP